MTDRWFGVALVGCCLASSQVPAQGPPGMGGDAPGCGAAIPGPLAPPHAPQGPPDDLSLPANVPNAFGCEPPKPPCCPRVYADFAYLAWLFKNPTLPGPLLTTSLGPATAASGSAADPNAFPLVTNGTLNNRSAFSGGRVTLGYFLDDKQLSALEVAGFIVGQGGNHVTVLSNGLGNPTIASPFINAQTGTPAVLQYALPGSVIGGASVSSNGRLFGGEANFVCNYPDCCILCCPVPFSLLCGARYLNLDEKISLNSLSQPLGNHTVAFDGLGFPAPAIVSSLDSFHTRNQFYGGQVGARLGWSFGPWFLGAQGKIAAGDVQEQVNVGGNTTLTVPNALPLSVPGHLYAVASNSGTFYQNKFAYVPEAEARFGFRFNPNFLAYVGYNFLYINRVARPGDQIDTVIDARQAPGSAGFQPGVVGTRPATLPITESTFWAQGVNVGFEITY